MENRNNVNENKEEKKQERKKAFFEQNEEKRASHPMTALEMAHLTSVYNNKYKIKIEMNGYTEHGQEAIRKNRENEENKIKEEEDSVRFEHHHEGVKSFIKSIIGSHEEKKIENENEYNSVYVGKNVFIDEFKKLRDKYVRLANECSLVFNPYPKGIDELIAFLSKQNDELTDEQKNDCLKFIESLKIIIDQYKQISDSQEMNQVLKDKISEFETARQTRLNDVGLTKEQAINEINEIRNDLKEGEIIGYVFTNNHLIKKNHFDVIIITKDLIIKPCEWNVDEKKTISSSFDIKNLSCLELIEPFVTHENKNCSLPYAQAGSAECGTLGMLNLKELLKNNSYQLKNLTMNIPFYDKDEKLHYLFIPSPDILRYSQSSTFNKIILSMFSDEPEVKVKFSQMVMIDPWANKKEKQEDIATVKTIVTMLKDTIEKAEKKGDKEIVKTCQTFLNQLPEFREKWMKNYDSAMSKRRSMQGGSYNEYLAYSTQRLRAKVSDHPQREEGTHLNKNKR